MAANGSLASPLAVALVFASSCGSSPSVTTGEGLTLFKGDAATVYKQTEGLCQYSRIADLATQYHTSPNRRAVLKAVADKYPAHRKAAIEGCESTLK